MAAPGSGTALVHPCANHAAGEKSRAIEDLFCAATARSWPARPLEPHGGGGNGDATGSQAPLAKPLPPKRGPTWGTKTRRAARHFRNTSYGLHRTNHKISPRILLLICPKRQELFAKRDPAGPNSLTLRQGLSLSPPSQIENRPPLPYCRACFPDKFQIVVNLRAVRLPEEKPRCLR